MTADQPRDWDRELAAIDKVIEQQRSGAPPPPTALPPGSVAPPPVVTPAPAARRGSVARTWFWTVLALALGIGHARGHTDVFLVGNDAHGVALSAAIGIGIGVIAVFATRLATSSWQWARVLHQEFHALVHQMSLRDVVLLALASSIAEEALFRGALQPMIGIAPQAALFAALHFRPRARFYPWTIMSLGIGLLFGWLTKTRGDLCAPILAHFTVNALNLAYISRTELRA